MLGALEVLALAAAGALQTLAFVATDAWPLQWLGIGFLAWHVARAGPGRAAWLGLAFGSGWLGAGTWWLFVSMHRYGGLPAWMAALAVALLCILLSLYLAVAMAAFARFRSNRPGRDAWLFAAVWLLAELARGVFFTGFPWVASGYAQVDAPLAGLAPWVGVYGIGFVMAALVAWLVQPRGGWRRVGLPAVAVVLALLLAQQARSLAFTEPSGTLNVSLLQGNVPQEEKFSRAHLPQALAWAHAQLLAAPGDLVVAPETVIPLLPAELDPRYWDSLLRHFQQGRQAALIGIPLGNEAAGYTNSAVGISAGTVDMPGGYYRYDKHHLVPFGEFIPTGFKWFTRMMHIPLGDFNRGPLAAPSFDVRGERVAPNICYEDLFGEELATRFREPAAAPTIFANLSNIGWFGKTIAVEQHLEISRMRSLEFQRPMIRATNTGATAVIDHLGVVTRELPPFTQGVLQGAVQGRVGVTPFAWWAARAGLGPLWALGAVLLLGSVLMNQAVRRARR